ncbi:MAG: hypothetical protein JWQ72_1255 [Polaromonas sp.]|nr:hypothetical protein [Polaromonas sp.]
MSLITRCPACGTMFKVVSDQLKVSRGWVRCGHCSDVFDATLHLQSATAPAQAVDHSASTAAPAVHAGSDEAPPPLPSSPSAHQEAEAAWAPGVFFADAQAAPSYPGTGANLRETQDFDPGAWRREQQAAPLDESGALRLNEHGEAVRVSPAIAGRTRAEPPAAAVVALLDHEDSELPEALPDEPAAVEDVSFVRDARRRAFWRKRGVRAALALAAVLLVCLLVLQVVVQQRDTLAAMEPRFKPVLQAVCTQLRCEVAPLHRIEALVIDSSSFNRVDGETYRLGFSLKNTGVLAVAMPALEVTLTDAQDQPVLRRVLSPGQWGASGPMLNAGAEFAGAVVLQVAADALVAAGPGASAASVATPPPSGTLRIAGYRLLAFYP